MQISRERAVNAASPCAAPEYLLCILLYGIEEYRANYGLQTGCIGQIATAFEASEPVRIEIDYEVLARLRGARFDLFLLTEEGDIAFTARTWTFEYSRASELTGGTLKDAAQVVQKSLRYLHDGSGNRVLKGEGSSAEYPRYNQLNQLTKVGGKGPALIEGTVNEPSTVAVNGQRTETVQVPGTSTYAVGGTALGGKGLFNLLTSDCP